MYRYAQVGKVDELLAQAITPSSSLGVVDNGHGACGTYRIPPPGAVWTVNSPCVDTHPPLVWPCFAAPGKSSPWLEAIWCCLLGRSPLEIPSFGMLSSKTVPMQYSSPVYPSLAVSAGRILRWCGPELYMGKLRVDSRDGGDGSSVSTF